MKPTVKKWLKRTAIGCGVALLLVGVVAVWIGLQIREMTGAVVLSDHHPFRSAAKKERYLANYDARASRWPVPSETVFVETSWGQTFVRVSGPVDGPPLVLLPGANATHLLFEPNIEAWAADHRVYAIDTIYDFGRSVYTRRPERPEDLVEWLDEALDGLGLDERVHLLGVSYGGWIASQFALSHPERLEDLVLIAPAATVAWFSADFVKYGLMCAIPHRFFVDRMMHWVLGHAADGTPEHTSFVDDAADNAWLGLRCFKATQLVHPTVLTGDELQSFEMPVLFLVGEHEVIYNVSAREIVDRLHNVAPAIEAEMLSGCGHDITVVRAETVNRRVLGFMAGGGAGPTKALGSS